MANFNRILNVLIVILATVALFFGTKLFKQRELVKNNRDKLAEEVAKTIDELKTVSPKNVTDKYGAEKLNKSSLNLQTYLNDPAAYDANLSGLSSLAKHVHSQRGELSEHISRVNDIFGLEDIEQIDLHDSALTSGAEGYFSTMQESMKKVNDRDEHLVEKLSETILKFKPEESIENIRDAESYQNMSADVLGEIDSMQSFNGKYRDLIKATISKLGGVERMKVSPEDVIATKDAAIERYKKSLENLMTQVKQVDNLKAENTDLKDNLAKKEKDLISSHAEIVKNETSLKGKDKEIADWKEKLAVCEGNGPEGPFSTTPFDGKITRIDYNYNYVVIDLGCDQKIPMNLTLTVARQQEYICQIKVTKIFKNYAVAEILTDMKKGSPIPEDRVVYLPAGS
ncbi:MAG: hypothetical protein MJH11_10335 [Lentisphaeria bacterium]|nr:hypothetical protein [Lentisphaeria bacterium]